MGKRYGKVNNMPMLLKNLISVKKLKYNDEYFIIGKNDI